jgi:plasmid stabilization system protein ParE
LAGTVGQGRKGGPTQTVAQIVCSENALANPERAFQFPAEHNASAALGSARCIREAVETLSNHPLIGRTIAGELRELVISYGKTGYIALYRFLPLQDQVRILAIRHQREIDFPVN